MISLSSFGMVSDRSSMLFVAKGRGEIIQKKGKDFTRVMAQTEEALTGFCGMKLLGAISTPPWMGSYFVTEHACNIKFSF